MDEPTLTSDVVIARLHAAGARLQSVLDARNAYGAPRIRHLHAVPNEPSEPIETPDVEDTAERAIWATRSQRVIVP